MSATRSASVVALYVASVVAANVVTASTDPLVVGPFIVTWGTWFIGATFFLRDAVQVRSGRTVAYVAIGAGLLLSVAFALVNRDVPAIVVASGVAFGVSEALDTEVFTRLRSSLASRVLLSGVAGGLLDSALFVLIGLSPMTTGIVPWRLVPAAILGQWLVKSALQALAAAAIHAREVEFA